MRLSRILGHAILGAAFAAVVFGESARAACLSAENALPAKDVQAFLNDPSQLLGEFSGGAEMIAKVRDLVASDAATLKGVLGVLGSADEAQQTAIGAGLGQAELLCKKPDAAFASQIQQSLVATNNDIAVTALLAVLADRPIGALGETGGGGGGAGNSYGQTGPNQSTGPNGFLPSPTTVLTSSSTQNPADTQATLPFFTTSVGGHNPVPPTSVSPH